MTVHGSCLCEGVKYEIEGDPFMFGVCHCTNCTKATGAAAADYVFFKQEVRVNFYGSTLVEADHLQRNLSWPSQQVTLTENPSGIISTFEDTKTESGNSLFRRFCTKCGSTLFIPKEDAGILIVAYGGLDNAPKEWTPTHEVWCKHKKGWEQQPVPLQYQGVSYFLSVMAEVFVRADFADRT